LNAVAGRAVEKINSTRPFARLVAMSPRRTLCDTHAAHGAKMPTFPFPPLPYPLDALSPTISAETMAIHHGKHQRAYVDKVNMLVADSGESPTSLVEVMRIGSSVLAQTAAQAWNHDFFFRCLTPKSTAPSAELAAAIEADFGSKRAFEEKLKSAATDLFGSGWIWLLKDSSGLKIASTPNAGLHVHESRVVPLLTIDVWEHAYYLDYKNERSRYVQGVWDLINWEFVSEQHARR
jgi:superoxide dismutase, Fe-Mn family